MAKQVDELATEITVAYLDAIGKSGHPSTIQHLATPERIVEVFNATFQAINDAYKQQ